SGDDNSLVQFPGLISQNGRTSTVPPCSKIGQPLANSAAASRVSAWTMEKPPTTSLVSTNGPSVTTLFALTTRPSVFSPLPLSSIQPFWSPSAIQLCHF